VTDTLSTPLEREAPRCLYTTTARPAVPTPPLRADVRTEVAIVGAGYTGLSAALHLAERGVAVTLLEAHEPGWGAAGRNGGQINAGLKHEPDDIERQLGGTYGPRLVQLAGEAPARLFALIDRFGIDCEARREGTLRAAYQPRHVAALHSSVSQWHRRDTGIEIWDAERVAARTGTRRYLAASFDPRGGSVNPLGLARGLAAAAISAGATIHGESRAQRLEQMQQRHAQHLAALKEKLKLTPAQEGAWNTFAAAQQPPARPAGQARMDRGEFAKLTTPQRLDLMQSRQAERSAQAYERERSRYADVDEQVQNDLRAAQESQQAELARARQEVERAMQEMERVQVELHERMQQTQQQQAEIKRRIHEHVQPMVEQQVKSALERAAVELEHAQHGSNHAQGQALEERLRSVEKAAADRSRTAQSRAGRGTRVYGLAVPQGGAPGGQRSLEERVAELERRLGLGGGQGGAQGGGSLGGVRGGVPGGVGRTPNPDADCTPGRGRVMVAPRGGQMLQGLQSLPNGQLHGRMVLPNGHGSFEIRIDGQGTGDVQFFGLDGDEDGESAASMDDDDDGDGDEADESDGDEMWDDSSADEDDDSGDDDDDQDADDDEDEDDDASGATTFNYNFGDGGANGAYTLKLSDLFAHNNPADFDWRGFGPSDFNVNGVTTASNTQPSGAGAQLRSLIDDMRKEVESLRGALGDLRSQVERRKQNQDSSLR